MVHLVMVRACPVQVEVLVEVLHVVVEAALVAEVAQVAEVVLEAECSDVEDRRYASEQ